MSHKAIACLGCPKNDTRECPLVKRALELGDYKMPRVSRRGLRGVNFPEYLEGVIIEEEIPEETLESLGIIVEEEIPEETLKSLGIVEEDEEEGDFPTVTKRR